MPKVDTWMPIYWGDYAKDTGHLSATHHGAYLMLIKHYWVTGEALPADDSQLWRIACMDSRAQWEKVKAIVLAFFEKRDARLVHERIETELVKAEGNAERRQELARRAANSRWNKDRRDAPRMPDAFPGECPSPSPSDNSHGKTRTVAARASASPDGPPRLQLPDSAKWAERLAGYRPWEGKTRWEHPWGPKPDDPYRPCFAPTAMHEKWLAECNAPKLRGQAA